MGWEEAELRAESREDLKEDSKGEGVKEV